MLRKDLDSFAYAKNGRPKSDGSVSMCNLWQMGCAFATYIVFLYEFGERGTPIIIGDLGHCKNTHFGHLS